MTRSINIYEAKTHLSRYLKEVQQGRTVTLCKNGEPVALMVPVPKKKSFWGHVGIAADLVGKIPGDFNEPLEEKDLPGFS